jgi:hypothetical protein
VLSQVACSAIDALFFLPADAVDARARDAWMQIGGSRKVIGGEAWRAAHTSLRSAKCDEKETGGWIISVIFLPKIED